MLQHQASATGRSMMSLLGAHEILIMRVFNVPPPFGFEAWTQPE